ncbi:hypothetical protein GQ55_3G013900 [Panicum hallii var. hallii]|uniref:Uncharacterized protein n=1 Tax=Panicum hallii var. hallii TaxID=1504633 RepID=A0A2T7E4L9_9POAL|nr:hypothetical protein GQ55_3G013900 [Panicum hallii var. hallii]
MRPKVAGPRPVQSSPSAAERAGDGSRSRGQRTGQQGLGCAEEGGRRRRGPRGRRVSGEREEGTGEEDTRRRREEDESRRGGETP